MLGFYLTGILVSAGLIWVCTQNEKLRKRIDLLEDLNEILETENVALDGAVDQLIDYMLKDGSTYLQQMIEVWNERTTGSGHMCVKQDKLMEILDEACVEITGERLVRHYNYRTDEDQKCGSEL